MFMFLSLFVMLMGQQELAMTRYRERRRQTPRVEVLEVRPAGGEVIDVGPPPPQPNFSGFVWDSRERLWVEWRDGRPVHRIQVPTD
jgi:hypothetical protein